METNNTNQPVNPSESSIQSSPVTNPVHNQRGFPPILLGALVLLVVVAGGAYYLGTQQNKPTSSTLVTSPSPTTNVKIESTTTPITSNNATTDTGVYTNKKYGIEFQYPKELYVYNDPTNNPNNENGLSLNKDDCNNFEGAYCGVQDSLFFSAKPANNLTIDQWVKSNLFKKSNITNNPSGGGFADDGEYCYNRSKQERLKVAGLDAHSYSFSWDQLGHPGKCLLDKSYNENYPDIIKEVYFSKNGWIFMFDLRYKKGSDLEKSLNQVLSTVKFTN